MSKTAEEIIYEQVGIKPGAKPVTPMDYGECLKCMREYAAQEVKAYKEKLTADIEDMNKTRKSWILDKVLWLINESDTVK